MAEDNFTTVRIPTDYRDTLKKIANNEKRSMAQQISFFIDQYLKIEAEKSV